MKLLASERPASAPDTARRTTCAPGGELRALTGLRIVAAAWVVAFHFHFTALPGVADVSALLGPLVTQGSLGVDLFFVLSGFVIAHTYLDVLGPRLRVGEAGRFVWARAGRMWPAYFLVFNLFGIWLVARAVLGSDTEIAFQAVQPTLSWGEWLRQAFLVQLWDRPYLDGASWVGPTWSISAEWLAYLLFPLSALVFFRLRRLPVVVLGLGALALMSPMVVSYAVLGSPYYPFSWVVRILCGFSAGVLAMLVVRRLRGAGTGGPATGECGTRAHPRRGGDGVEAERNRRVASVLAVVAIGGIVAGLLAGVVLGTAAVGAVTVLFPVLVGSLALADRGPARLLGSRPMVHGGRISYALYLVHIPMFEVFWLALRRYGGDGVLAAGSMTAHLVALAVLVATIPAAHLLFTLVEQPARRWMRDLPDAGRRAAARRSEEVAAGSLVPEQGRVDNRLARLDPPTAMLPRLPAAMLPVEPAPASAEVPRQQVRLDDAPHPVLDGPVPVQQLDTAPWVVTRLTAARDAGHGDDREGDRLAGNLMAAARLRSVPPDGLFDPAPRAEQVRALRERSMTGPPRPQPQEPQERPLRAGERDAAVATAEPAEDAGAVPGPRADRSGSRTGVERCSRGRGRHSAHSSAATPIVAAAAASVRGGPVRRRRRPTHGLHYRDT